MHLRIFVLVLLHSAVGERIIGGEHVSITEYPHQAALYRRQYSKDLFQCGAVIVSSNYVLTAAHCKRGPPKQYSIVIGESEVPHSDKDDFLEGLTYQVKSFVIHPKFDMTTVPMFDHDIAVLTMERELEFDGVYAKAIKLVSQPTDPGVLAKISGYGNTERHVIPRPRGDTHFRLLKAAEVPTVAFQSCEKYFKEHHPGYHITKNMICAGHPCHDDACQGDSGGPLTVDDELVGLVSYGRGCGSYDPGVYTNVYEFMDFIKNETNGLLGDV